jgi:hypothetical protein
LDPAYVLEVLVMSRVPEVLAVLKVSIIRFDVMKFEQFRSPKMSEAKFAERV